MTSSLSPFSSFYEGSSLLWYDTLLCSRHKILFKSFEHIFRLRHAHVLPSKNINNDVFTRDFTWYKKAIKARHSMASSLAQHVRRSQFSWTNIHSIIYFIFFHLMPPSLQYSLFKIEKGFYFVLPIDLKFLERKRLSDIQGAILETKRLRI